MHIRSCWEEDAVCKCTHTLLASRLLFRNTPTSHAHSSNVSECWQVFTVDLILSTILNAFSISFPSDIYPFPITTIFYEMPAAKYVSFLPR